MRRHPFLKRLACCLALLVLGSLKAAPLRAQVPADTTQVPPADTLPPPPQVAPFDPETMIGFMEAEPGIPAGNTELVLTRFLDAATALQELPGTFLYRLGPTGWPHGWAPFGLPPHRTTLTLNGLPFDDLFSGQPRHDLLPLELLTPLRVEPARLSHPLAAHAAVRAFQITEPLTELRYRGGGHELQYISAMHAQERIRTLAGQPGRLNILFNVIGRRSAGDYPNSRHQASHVYARIRYEQTRWSVELSNLLSRTTAGAHGGVLPQQGAPFASIYSRLAAQVADPATERQTIRNDLALRLRLRWSERMPPLSLLSYWSAQTFRSLNPAPDLPAALFATADRFGLRVQQALPPLLPGHRFTARADGWATRLRQSNALPLAPGALHNRLHLALRDSIRLPGADLVVEGGASTTGSIIAPSAEASIRFGPAAANWFAEAWHTGTLHSWIEQHGWHGLIAPSDAAALERMTQLRTGLALRGGTLDGLLFGYARQVDAYQDLYLTGDRNHARYATSARPLRWLGLGGDFGWRRDETRGFWATLRPSLFYLLDPQASDQHLRAAASLPRLYADGRLGIRYLLFQGDLDLNLYLQGSAWSAMRSRAFQAPTALFPLPAADARTFGPAGTLDVFAEAGIQAATVFVAYENALAGTFYPGTLIVPVYPLPQQHFRFGVFWPIWN